MSPAPPLGVEIVFTKEILSPDPWNLIILSTKYCLPPPLHTPLQEGPKT